MTAKCLSAFECEFIRAAGHPCDICQKGHEQYLERELKRAITDAKRLLEHHGYTILEKGELR